MKRYSTIMSVLLTLALPVAGSCADAPAAPEKADAKPAQETQKSPHSMMGMGQQGGEGADVNPSGKVVETMNGGGYTYVNLEKDGKTTWVAYPAMDTRVGENLSFRGCMEMAGFQSKALNRKFESILFCSGPEVKPKAEGQKVAKKEEKKPAQATGPVKVEKATGANAYTVEEIFKKSSALNGKQVVVRGEVVKIASGIMNRNWVHLQDGTGSEKKKTNDLVVTTQELPKEGDVVTFSGTLAKDKDFGGGYKYNAIIEKGTIQK